MIHLRRILTWFVYSNLFIAVCTIGMTLHTYGLLLPGSPPGSLLPFVFFSTLCSYSFHFYFSTHSILPSPRVQWVRHYRWLHVLFFFTGLAGACWFFIPLWKYRLWILAPVLVTFLYSATKIPHPFTKWMRRLAFGKTFFLAATWTYVTVVLPLFLSDAAWTPGFSIYAAGRFFFIYALSTLFDYRDRADDLEKGVRSMATLLPEKKIQTIFLLFLSVYFLFTLLLFNTGFTFSEILPLFIPGLLLLALAEPSKKNHSDLLYYLVLDGLMALPALLHWLIRI